MTFEAETTDVGVVSEGAGAEGAFDADVAEEFEDPPAEHPAFKIKAQSAIAFTIASAS